MSRRRRSITCLVALAAAAALPGAGAAAEQLPDPSPLWSQYPLEAEPTASAPAPPQADASTAPADPPATRPADSPARSEAPAEPVPATEPPALTAPEELPFTRAAVQVAGSAEGHLRGGDSSPNLPAVLVALAVLGLVANVGLRAARSMLTARAGVRPTRRERGAP